MAPLPAGTNELTEPRRSGRTRTLSARAQMGQIMENWQSNQKKPKAKKTKITKNTKMKPTTQSTKKTMTAQLERNCPVDVEEVRKEYIDNCTRYYGGNRRWYRYKVHLLDRAACDIIRKDRDEWLRAAAVDNKAIRHGVFGTEACQLLADVCEKAERATVVKKEESGEPEVKEAGSDEQALTMLVAAATWLEEKGEFSSNCYDL
ncbi:hypothetical protein GLAREA_00954 [Glarea lozoyensis ATCC 20868]|uniref:Uncharacterized protein n=1 Tax=Glarea lozoyensis (strain ATCC 20868 / MF5171) TaxID=1116229 RepID=S3CXZ5_GLAL2|nr:uncharacterized protein GLAREA_00954 [Glarea lozoyensis ATCC 20868]EPE29794.1 hypothetical protein GLAREA_00954 [Glarea lozoyensis ATCC 20868]